MIWITADLHLNHQNIIRYCKRPFSSLEEMDTVIISNINSSVKKDDELWILGDFCFGNPEKYIDQIKCQNRNLILGNHDYNIPKERWRKLFDLVEDLYLLKTSNGLFCLSHYAMKVWPFQKKNCINLHGHSHQVLKNPEFNSLDVGIDGFKFKPIPISIIRKMVDSRNSQR